MIDTAFKTHKETAFGWVWALQALWRLLRRRSEVRRYPRLIAPR